MVTAAGQACKRSHGARTGVALGIVTVHSGILDSVRPRLAAAVGLIVRLLIFLLKAGVKVNDSRRQPCAALARPPRRGPGRIDGRRRLPERIRGCGAGRRPGGGGARRARAARPEALPAEAADEHLGGRASTAWCGPPWSPGSRPTPPGSLSLVQGQQRLARQACVLGSRGSRWAGVAAGGGTESPSVLESMRLGRTPLGLAGQLFAPPLFAAAPRPPPLPLPPPPPPLPSLAAASALQSIRTRRRKALSAICAAASSSLHRTAVLVFLARQSRLLPFPLSAPTDYF